jgi:osmotically-inducible protein OsmY
MKNNNLQLKLKVAAELKCDPLLSPVASEIDVTASDSVITLSGRVGSFLLKNAAEEAALRVEGVEAVAMLIEVFEVSSQKNTK